MHIAGKFSRRITTVAVEGAILIVQPQPATAALQRIPIPITPKRVGEYVARIRADAAEFCPFAGVGTINPHD